MGVLIALAIGEVADMIRWQVRAAHSNTAINLELARAAGVLDERVMVQPCLDSRIEQLDRIVRAARSNNILPDLGEIGHPPSRPVQTAAWDDATGSGTLLHLKPERRSMLSIDYPVIAAYANDLQQEQILWASLRALEHAPGRISDDMITEASTTIARLRQASSLNLHYAQQTRDDIVASGVVPSYLFILDREGSRAEVAVAQRPVCQPLLIRRGK